MWTWQQDGDLICNMFDCQEVNATVGYCAMCNVMNEDFINRSHNEIPVVVGFTMFYTLFLHGFNYFQPIISLRADWCWLKSWWILIAVMVYAAEKNFPRSKKKTPSPETIIWLVVLSILKNISHWEGLSHILWKIKNVWNHQPDKGSRELTDMNGTIEWECNWHEQGSD